MRPSMLLHASLAASALYSRDIRGGGIAPLDRTIELIGCDAQQEREVTRAHISAARMAVFTHESISQVLEERPAVPDPRQPGAGQKIYDYLRWMHTSNHMRWLFGFQKLAYEDSQRDVDKQGWLRVPETYKKMADFFKRGGLTNRRPGTTHTKLAYLCNPDLFKYHDWDDKDPDSPNQGDNAPKLVDRNEVFKDAQSRGYTGMAGVAGRFQFTNDKTFKVCKQDQWVALTVPGQHMIVLCKPFWDKTHDIAPFLENFPYMNTGNQPNPGLVDLAHSQEFTLLHEHAHAFGIVFNSDGTNMDFVVIDEQLRGVYDDQAGKLMYLKTDTDGKESLTDSETPKPVIAYGLVYCLSLAQNLPAGHAMESNVGPHIAMLNADTYAYLSLTLWADGWDWFPDGLALRKKSLASYRLALKAGNSGPA